MGADEPRFRVLHVSNISMTATREQIYQLFAFIGRIDEFKVCSVIIVTELNCHIKFSIIQGKLFILDAVSSLCS